jgi:hypothetical protein
VHDATHFRRRNKDAVFETLDAEKSVAGAIGADGPFDRAAGLRRNTVPGFVSGAGATAAATRRGAWGSFSSTGPGPTRSTMSTAGPTRSTGGSTRPSGGSAAGARARALTLRPRPAPLLLSTVGRRLFLVRPGLPVRPPELRSTRAQLTAPDPVRTLRGLPHLPGWRNW